jgi:hypothetical protein
MAMHGVGSPLYPAQLSTYTQRKKERKRTKARAVPQRGPRALTPLLATTGFNSGLSVRVPVALPPPTHPVTIHTLVSNHCLLLRCCVDVPTPRPATHSSPLRCTTVLHSVLRATCHVEELFEFADVRTRCTVAVPQRCGTQNPAIWG